MAVELSVVIPSYRRERRLQTALDALAAQTLGPGRFEVIVVRDSEDGDGPLAQAPAGLDVRFFTHPAPGPAQRRNRGVAESTGELVVFTDDDCRPDPGWLEAMLAASRVALASGGTGSAPAILQGRTEPDPEEHDRLWGLARSMRIREPNRWFPTCNLAYPRELLDELGGFDETIPFFGEDTDLGLRAERAGAELRFVPEALVLHAVHDRTLRDGLRDATQRHGEPAILRRYPEHRAELQWGLFVSDDHARLMLLLAAFPLVLRGRRRPLLAALAAYPYVAAQVRKPPYPRLTTPRGIARAGIDLSRYLVVDVAEVTMRAVSSFRHRSPVL